MNKNSFFLARLFGYMAAFSIVKLLLIFIDDDPLIFDRPRALKIAIVAAVSLAIFLLLGKYRKSVTKSV